MGAAQMIVDNLEALADKGYEAPGTPRSSTDGVTEFASGSLDLEVDPLPRTCPLQSVDEP